MGNICGSDCMRGMTPEHLKTFFSDNEAKLKELVKEINEAVQIANTMLGDNFVVERKEKIILNLRKLKYQKELLEKIEKLIILCAQIIEELNEEKLPKNAMKAHKDV